MREITVPIGPGKGQTKTVLEALQALISEMRGHIQDLRDTEEPEQADLLEKYAAALELILWQGSPRMMFGVQVPEHLIGQALKYHLVLPGGKP